MRSPWIDLLLLHGHATAPLAWRTDEPECEHSSQRIDVDIACLPLTGHTVQERTCRA